jgi:hypothetical protein
MELVLSCPPACNGYTAAVAVKASPLTLGLIDVVPKLFNPSKVIQICVFFVFLTAI